MSDILDQIVASKRREVERARERTPLAALEKRLGAAPAVRDFYAALASAAGSVAATSMAVIAEVKKASPSAGVMREDFDPVGIGRTYAAAGADAISVLTDEEFFQGRLEYLTAIRGEVGVPVLRKDFLLDPYQVVETRAAGADAVLLIAEILEDPELAELLRLTRELGMEALVEIHEAENLSRVIDAGAKVLGINNRNLRTFETRLEHTLELAERVPKECLLVSESGIKTRADVERLRQAGVRAVLVGETLMRAADMRAKVRELKGE